MDLLSFQNCLHGFILETWPEYGSWPFLGVNLLERTVYSDLALKLGKYYGRSPTDFEICLTNYFHESFPELEVDFSNHYCNFKFEQILRIANFLAPVEHASKNLLLVLSPKFTKISSLSLARLFSRILIQLNICQSSGVSFRFLYNENIYSHLSQQLVSDIWKTFKKGSSSISAEGFIELCRSSALEQESMCLWLSPKSLDHKFFLKVCGKSDPAVSQIWSVTPEAAWLEDRDAPDLKEFGEYDSYLSSYLASQIRAIDLDPAVPKLQESSNLLWFMESILERLNSSVGRDREALANEHFFLYTQAYTLLRRNVVDFADVAGFIGFVEVFAKDLVAYLNRPDVPEGSGSSQINHNNQYLSSIQTIVCDIITLLRGAYQ